MQPDNFIFLKNNRNLGVQAYFNNEEDGNEDSKNLSD